MRKEIGGLGALAVPKVPLALLVLKEGPVHVRVSLSVPTGGGTACALGVGEGVGTVLGVMGMLPMGLGAAPCVEGDKERGFCSPLAVLR